MPKILAESIHANRDYRQAKILQAATEIATESGLQSVTVGAVAERAGLARSSVYAYFATSADLIADVLVDELLDFAIHLEKVSLTDIPASEFLSTWIDAAFEYIVSGKHSLVRSAASVELPATRRAQIRGLHHQLFAPLMQLMSAAGTTEPMRSGQQISALIDVAVNRIEQGGDPDVEITALKQTLHRIFPELI